MESRTLKWVSGGMEAFFGIPFIGGLVIIGFRWTPLLLMLILHIVSLVLSTRQNKQRTGHILGIVTSCVGWIPFVGMVMHIITAIFLLTEASKNKEVAY